jgi:hypothetical protein
MTCPRCQQDSLSSQKFCGGCGTPLSRPNTSGPPGASYTDLERALSESLEQQTAAAEILRVISSSPTDVQPVFEAIADSASSWFLDLNGNGQWDGCVVDACLGFGLPGDLPVVGDWTGTGDAKIGVFRDGLWCLDLSGNGEWDGCSVDACIGFGLARDRAIAGAW